jgi:hypothetical protein
MHTCVYVHSVYVYGYAQQRAYILDIYVLCVRKCTLMCITVHIYSLYLYAQVCISNTNRQLCALSTTVGRPKAQVNKGGGRGREGGRGGDRCMFASAVYI